MTGPPCPVVEDNTVPPARTVESTLEYSQSTVCHFRHSAPFVRRMRARLVSVVFAGWLFALAEQVTAVRDVLCLSHKTKVKQIRECGSGRYRTATLTPRSL